jgi:ABC-type antimicrobial peptide transport system permease subunit
VALVVLLGILLIYSLLLNDVEEKTYEYGMLRALGFKQRSLIQVGAERARHTSAL